LSFSHRDAKDWFHIMEKYRRYRNDLRIMGRGSRPINPR
jgi:hypothetical protein